MIPCGCTVYATGVAGVADGAASEASLRCEGRGVGFGDLARGFGGSLVDVGAELEGGGTDGRVGFCVGVGGAVDAVLGGGAGAGVEGLETAGSVENDAEVPCEGGSEGCWSCFWVDLGRS